MNRKNHSNALIVFALAIFAIFSGIWAYMQLFAEPTENQLLLLSATYGVMALYGGVVGLFISRKWGGVRSRVGRAIFFMSLGLLAQEFGQIAYSVIGYFGTEVPYPSIGDIGYFGSIPLYGLGLINLIKASTAKVSLRSLNSKIAMVFVPVILLAASYAIFLRGYEPDFSAPLVVGLDFGYPLGQAFYLALAILAFMLSRKLLGGVMKPVLLFLMVALVVQYISDFTFLYMNNRETWTIAGISDYIYFVSYFVMTLALTRFSSAYNKISGGE